MEDLFLRFVLAIGMTIITVIFASALIVGLLYAVFVFVFTYLIGG